MSSNNEEVRRKLYIVQIRGARVTRTNNNAPLSASPCVLFPNKHMQAQGAPKVQPTMELKK